MMSRCMPTECWPYGGGGDSDGDGGVRGSGIGCDL